MIGHIHDEEFLVVEFADDGATAVWDGGTGRIVPLNRDRSATEGFLQGFADYLASGGPSSAPRVMTAEQAAERLAAFRAGRITPPQASTAIGHDVRLKTLLRTLTDIDREAATGPESWWSGPIEQAEDDLI